MPRKRAEGLAAALLKATDERVGLNLTSEEARRLASAAKERGLTVGAYIRSQCCGTPQETTAQRQVRRKIWAERQMASLTLRLVCDSGRLEELFESGRLKVEGHTVSLDGSPVLRV